MFYPEKRSRLTLKACRGTPSKKEGNPFADNRRLNNLLDSLFATVEQPQLLLGHRTAACNALCGFLDQGCLSSAPEVQQLCQNHAAWSRLLRLYLERLQDPSARSMKQVLNTLVKLLSRDTPRVKDIGNGGFSNFTEEATLRCLEFVCGDGDLSCIKPSMMMLYTLLSKEKIKTDFLLSLFSTVKPGNVDSKQDQALSFKTNSMAFVREVLRWAHHVDISLAAGRLLATFLSSLYTIDGDGESNGSGNDDKPLWTELLVDFALENDGMPRITEAYILPSLLRADSATAMRFLRSLPLNKILHGEVGSLNDKQIRFCLLTAKVADDDNLENATSEIKNPIAPRNLLTY